jgi:hypothetical protein
VIPPVHQPSQPPKPKRLDRLRETLRVAHYSIRTEDTYVKWVKRFIIFHGKRPPLEMGEGEVERFLAHKPCPRAGCGKTARPVR